MVGKNQDIPEMNLNNIKQYDLDKKNQINEKANEAQKNLDKRGKEINKLKNSIIKKYPFIQSIGILPSQSIKLLLEEEIGDNIPQQEMEKLLKKIHFYVIVPEEKLKEIPAIKTEIIKLIEKEKQNIWVHVKTPVDVWETGLNSKFEILSAIGMSFPLFDSSGILKGLRVAQVHKSLVLQKFEQYVVSYVLGGSLVRGDTIKTSDVDSFIIINDTDVKRMPRLELKERLRGIIHQFISEAYAIAGVKENILNVQVYLLTDFWESVKDAQPIMFTFIRDGVPIYDRGTFMPWKALLKMGKLKPSPEAIDMFMSMGDKTVKRAKRALLDILVHDIYWGVLTPAQALLMLYGLPPPTTKEAPKKFREIFVEKEKMLEAKYANILEKVVKSYKEYEHEKLKEVKGIEIDKMIKDTEDYLNRLKELGKQIEKAAEKKTIEEISKNAFDLLKAITGKKSQAAIISDFEEMVKSGKFTSQHLKMLNNIIAAKDESKKGKSNLHKIDKVRKGSTTLINDLIEYSQRKDLIPLEKGRMMIKYKDNDQEKVAEIMITEEGIFLFKGKEIKKITDGVEISNMGEVSKALEKQKGKKNVSVDSERFELLKEELGDFEIIL